MAKERIYIVKKGDTLWGISKKYLKNENNWGKLLESNPHLKAPDRYFPEKNNLVIIQPGEKLKLPNFITHTVKKGDTLWDISKHYYDKGNMWKEILTANPWLIDKGRYDQSTDNVLILPNEELVIKLGDINFVE